MASLNQTQLIGHLGRDVELRYLANGDAVAALNVATTDKWKDKATGDAREATEWHRCVIYGKLAEIAGQYLKKGSLVYLQGKATTRQYTDKDGAEKYVHEVKVDTMQMLDRAPSNQAGNQAGAQQRPATAPAQPQTRPAQQNQRPAPQSSQTGGFPDLDDDIPFFAHAAGRAWSSV